MDRNNMSFNVREALLTKIADHAVYMLQAKAQGVRKHLLRQRHFERARARESDRMKARKELENEVGETFVGGFATNSSKPFRVYSGFTRRSPEKRRRESGRVTEETEQIAEL